MELVLEILNTGQSSPSQENRKVFSRTGGQIGRSTDSVWVLADPDKRVSRLHASIAYDGSHFCLTDQSTNGTWLKASGARLERGVPTPVEDGAVYLMGSFEVRAQVLRESVMPGAAVSPPTPADNGMTIPEGADFSLAPMASEDRPSAIDTPVITPQQCADYALIEREHLLTPTLVPAPSTPEPAPQPAPSAQQSYEFWQRFGEALGIDLEALDQPGREALAVSAARLFTLSVAGLQQSLRTRNELKNELRLALTTTQHARKNPLKHAANASEAVASLLLDSNPPLSAEQAITRAYHDIQAHQVALLSASRAALRSTLEHFAPQHLSLRFERDGHKPLFATAGSLWRAYGRYHQALGQDDDWSERLLARDFTRAYEEQVRLVDSLHTDYRG